MTSPQSCSSSMKFPLAPLPTEAKRALRVRQGRRACPPSVPTEGQPAQFGQQALNYLPDQTAINDQGRKIGQGTKSCHCSHIISRSRLGKGRNVGENVVISPG